MQTQILIQSLVILTALGATAYYLFNKRNLDTSSLSIITISIAAWGGAALLFSLPTPVINRETLTSIHYLCVAAAAIGQFVFAHIYTNRVSWMNNRVRWLHAAAVLVVFGIPLALQAAFWTDSLKTNLFLGVNSIGERINSLYAVSVLVTSITFLVDTFVRKPTIHLMRSGSIMIGALLPLAAQFIFSADMDLQAEINFSILIYSLTVIGFTYGLFSKSLIETTPVTRDFVVEGMDDGWMVVDNKNRVIDLNGAAEELIGLSHEKIYGEPITQILTDWPKMLSSTKGNKEIEMRRSVKSKNEWRYLNIHISKLTDQNNVDFGHLILWRDVTGRKLATEARQRARDELFVLMNAVSNAASRSVKVEDFLSESSYQIVYSFRSQAVAIFLMEQEHGQPMRLELRSHFGLSAVGEKVFGKNSMTDAMVNWLVNNIENQPLTIDKTSEPSPLSAGFSKLGFECTVLIPLLITTEHENQLIGCLCLGRNENIPYSSDELVRLSTISNHIATLIDNDRRRQFSISQSERQRLLRDLHDSVSQKLYGLVALTEAAQAGMEAGSQIAPLQVLTRIGENARQAVKEMRLFLYEMQPMDLKDGLVSTLHHRLTAVEGRADIKARLIADEDIQLTKDNEIALYYIAQEALNNILRHAHAKTVSITLKQTRQNVILTITDDGRGFDHKNVDQGGLGLSTMKERALQANGKYKITSKVGSGTKITVTVGRKR